MKKTPGTAAWHEVDLRGPQTVELSGLYLPRRPLVVSDLFFFPHLLFLLEAIQTQLEDFLDNEENGLQ